MDWAPVKMSTLDEAKTGSREEEEEGKQKKNYSGRVSISKQ